MLTSIFHGEGVDWPLEPMILTIAKNQNSIMKTNIIILALTIFEPC
jgi:hypothetical protein